MVSLLGPRDEHLSLIEQAFDADVHVRGNEFTVREAGENRQRRTPRRELVTILRTGQGLSTETVERAVELMRTETQGVPPTS